MSYLLSWLFSSPNHEAATKIQLAFRKYIANKEIPQIIIDQYIIVEKKKRKRRKKK